MSTVTDPNLLADRAAYQRIRRHYIQRAGWYFASACVGLGLGVLITLAASA